MNKQEIKDLKKHNINPDNIVKPNGQVFDGLIILSNGSKDLHDSGYPFIRIFGIIADGLVDLGWHDHYLCYVPINIDSYGKNIFHLMLWRERKKKLKVKDDFCSYSTFEIGDMYKQDDDFIFVE
jgi:hypothetical protein